VSSTVCDIPALCEVLDELSRKLDCTLVLTLSSLATLASTAPQRGPFVEPHFRRVGSAARLAGRIRPPLTCTAGLIYNDA
jgi:hypothetical protein